MKIFKMSKDTLLHYAKLSSLAYAKEPQMVYSDLGYDTKDILNQEGVQAFLLQPKIVENYYVIAIRGTDEPRDISRDAFFMRTRVGGGRMHKGFYNGAKIIHEWLIRFYAYHQVDSSSINNVYVGHSLGGALANASILHFDKQGMAVTFGCPMVVDEDFVVTPDHYHIRVRNCNDIVTKLPSEGLGYMHTGDLHYIDFNSNIKSKISIFDGLRARFRAWKKKQLFSGYYDHDLQQYIKKLSK